MTSYDDLNVYVYPADRTGCGHYRLIWPAQACQVNGLKVTVVAKEDVDRQFQARMIGDEMVDVSVPEGMNVIVLQRPTHRFLHKAIPLMRAKGIAVVVDMDDDLASIDPRNPAFGLMHPASPSEHAWANAQVACEKATLVTLSTPALLDVYARRSPGQVLPNYVPHYFTQLDHDDSCVIGWGGSIHSHPDDLQSMGPAIARLSRELPFIIVGPEKGVTEALGATVAERVEATGAIEFLEWPKELAKRVGVGVAPTADTRFNRAKSWLKPLEYAACAVPSVASNRPEYARLSQRFGACELAESPKDWYRVVKQLARNGDMRRTYGEAARLTVMNYLTIERNVENWASAWLRALQIQRGEAN